MQLFEKFDALEKQKKIDYTMDFIRNQFGFDKVRRASTLVDTELCCFNVKEEHDGYHPIGYFRGRRMKDGTI